MKHDTRRGPGQWRGCPSFKGISSGNESHTPKPSRNEGLKMGSTYYYYYEVDGSTETHDPARPSTSACPYLPGQTVNTLYVPIEQNSRLRSASVNSLRQESYMTMDPEARFVTPVPQTSTLAIPAIRRLGSASSLLHGRPTSRSESVGPSWKRLFGRRSRDANIPTTAGHEQEDIATPPTGNTMPYSRPPSSLEGRRTRDISPESLRQFLVDDVPPPPDSAANDLPSLSISSEFDYVVDEDDDENFATSAISENQVFGTSLSPPPFQRSVSMCAVPQDIKNSSSLTLTIKTDVQEEAFNEQQLSAPTSAHQLPKLDTNEISQCNWSPTISSSTFTTPMSPQSLEDETTCYYDSNDDDDDILSNIDGDYLSYRCPSNMPNGEAFKGYSLPRRSAEDKVLESANSPTRGVSTSLLTARDSDVPIPGTNYLGKPIDTGLDDFVSELGLMVEVISNKRD